MVAEVESMAYAGAVPWHGKGEPISEEDGRSCERTIVKSGLNWLVEKVRLMTFDTREVVNRYATRRVSDRKILGDNVGPRFHILQNPEAFRWFQPFLDAGLAVLHTAGSLRGGTIIWVLAKLNRDPLVITPGDEVDKYVLLSHAHDTRLSIRVGFTPVRTVCWNTLALAHDSDASKLIRVRHTKSMHANLANLREAMNLANAEFEASAELYQKLAHRDINQNDVVKYVKLALGVTDPKPSTRMLNTIEEILRLHEEGKGANIPGVRGTLWGAYNAFTEYLSYQRGHSIDARLDSLWYGEGRRMNQTALDAALAMAT
jgi:phage/plasmid-like protein (TIGR03299 family)